MPALLWWGDVRLMSYPWALLALFLGAQATCETPGCQRYLVYKDKAPGILNLLWLFHNIFYEQGLVLIWLRMREFWEWKATVDLAFGSQARLAIMAGSSFSELSGVMQRGRVEAAVWKMSRVSCSRVSMSSFLESTGSDLHPLYPGVPKISYFHLPGVHISHPKLSLKRFCV